ncbi:MAG: cyclic lactone autoinducer peptide [Clostridiales bacterium]|nr:cyclic lactone autoinducer peptide [Clostridiales bacterium]
MFSQLKTIFLTSVCSILAFIAVANVGGNCFGLIYEPEVPESLKN